MEQFAAPYHKAVYVGESTPDYTNGKEYEIHITKMSDGRFQVFKSLAHWQETSGHMVVKSLEEVKTKFNYK